MYQIHEGYAPVRKSQPTPGDVHVNAPLTQISIAFLQEADKFIADRVFPNIPVAKQSDRFYTYDRGMFNRDEMQERAPGAEAAEVGYTVDNTPTYFAKVYALHVKVPDERRANADSVLQPDREATELLIHKAMIKRESLWATKFFATGIWAEERAGVAAAPAGTQFLRWDVAGSTPLKDLRGGKQAVKRRHGFEPNKLILGSDVWNTLVDHADFVDRLNRGQTPVGPAKVNRAQLASILEIEEVMVADGVVNTALEGAANVHSFVLGKHALLVYAAPRPGLMVPSGGYTFSWTGFLGAAPQGFRIFKLRDDKAHSDWVEIEMAFDQKLISSELGAFFLNAVS